MFKFLTKQPFWVNLLAALLLLFLLIFLFLQSLNWLTNHGAYLKVPTVKGLRKAYTAAYVKNVTNAENRATMASRFFELLTDSERAGIL